MAGKKNHAWPQGNAFDPKGGSGAGSVGDGGGGVGR